MSEKGHKSITATASYFHYNNCVHKDENYTTTCTQNVHLPEKF